MDRNTVIATVLIALVMVAWLTWFSPQPPAPVPAVADTTAVADARAGADQPVLGPADSTLAAADSTLGAAAAGTARTITVVTDAFTATISTRGASLLGVALTEYQQADRRTPVQIVDTAAAPNGALGLVFTTPRSRTVDTRSLFFQTPLQGDTLRLTADSVALPFEANVAGGTLRFTYVFYKEGYALDWRVEQRNAGAFSTPDGYDVVWDGAVPFTEETHREEAQRSGAYARSGGETESVTLLSEPTEERRLSGVVEWVAVKNKYFTAALVPTRETAGAEISGSRQGELDSPTLTEAFNLRLDMPALPEGRADRFRLYLGPMEYDQIAGFRADLYDMVDYGWDWMEVATRPIAKFVFVPFFSFFGTFLPNYGLVLVLFALLIKLATHPLTRAQAKSMLKMRAIQPRTQALKEKYANDPQKLQQATMQLYKQAGVNPLGGCLPLLLQYPVLIALYQYVPQSMYLRQQPFLWAPDLSAPDPILQLPFTIPFYGNFVAGFTLLMGLALVVQMRVQMKSQPAATPEMQVQVQLMQWLLPLMLFVFFNQAASGLSLYYLCYNVFSALEQWWIRKTTPELTFGDEDEGDATAPPAPPRSTPPKRKLEAQAAVVTSNGKSRR